LGLKAEEIQINDIFKIESQSNRPYLHNRNLNFGVKKFMDLTTQTGLQRLKAFLKIVLKQILTINSPL